MFIGRVRIRTGFYLDLWEELKAEIGDFLATGGEREESS